MARSHHDDQPRKLPEALRAPAHLYQLNVRVKNGGYGNLVLSRWPFRPSPGLAARKRRKPRGAQMAVVETPEGPFHLVHWHLGLAERERHWQVRHLLEHALFRESEHLPTLIVGDFNDWLNTLARGPFARHGFVQVTAPRWRFRSFPAYRPVASLDKAFVRGPWRSATRGSPTRGWPAMPPTICRSSLTSISGRARHDTKSSGNGADCRRGLGSSSVSSVTRAQFRFTWLCIPRQPSRELL